MHAAKEIDLGRGQRIGHGFVGRQHELFDDLVADRILHAMGADHASLLVEIDLHFLHG